MTQEALKLALEALETPWNSPYVDGCDLALGKRVKAITAIKEALAQPEQEPVAFDCCGNCLRPKHEHQGDNCPKPYTTTWNAWDYPFAPDTTPPQRTWVGLTDEDRKQITRKANYHWEMTAGEYAERIGQLTESKLKELNT